MKNNSSIKKALAIMMSLTLLMGLTGCEQGNTDIQTNEAAESSASESAAEIKSDVQTEESTPKNEVQKLNTWQFPDDPKDYTVDDYRHMVSINGITITLPTTINELKKLDEKFGYKVDYVYDGVNQVRSNGGTGYDIYITYDDKNVCLSSLYSEPDEKYIPDANLFFLYFGNALTDNSIDFKIFDELELGSDISDVHKKMGAPTTPIREITEQYQYTYESHYVNVALGYKGQKELGSAIISIRENDGSE